MTGRGLHPSSFLIPPAYVLSPPPHLYLCLSVSGSLSFRWIRHHERFTVVLLTRLSQPQPLLPPPFPHRQPEPVFQNNAEIEGMRPQATRDAGRGRAAKFPGDCVYGRLWVLLCACVDWAYSVPLGGTCSERLSEHVMCDRWRTVSISSLTHTHTRKHSDTHKHTQGTQTETVDRCVPASADDRAEGGNMELA